MCCTCFLIYISLKNDNNYEMHIFYICRSYALAGTAFSSFLVQIPGIHKFKVLLLEILKYDRILNGFDICNMAYVIALYSTPAKSQKERNKTVRGASFIK